MIDMGTKQLGTIFMSESELIAQENDPKFQAACRAHAEARRKSRLAEALPLREKVKQSGRRSFKVDGLTATVLDFAGEFAQVRLSDGTRDEYSWPAVASRMGLK